MLAGIVLAAGHSRRFGADDKLLARFEGAALAAHAAAAMRAARIDLRIAVVRSANVAALFDGFRIVQLADGAAAQADSVAAGVGEARRLGARRVLIALADMPFVDAALIDAVAAMPGDAAASDGTRRAPPAAFGAERFDALLALTGDSGAGALIRALPETSLVAATPARLRDIDRPGDLAAFSAARSGR